MAVLTPSLAAQRSAIDAVDSALLSLIACRRSLVSGLFEEKRSSGLPLLDPEREVVLLEQWRACALRTGVPQALAEDLLRLLLNDSHSRA